MNSCAFPWAPGGFGQTMRTTKKGPEVSLWPLGVNSVGSASRAFVIRAEPDLVRGRETTATGLFDLAIAQQLAKRPQAFFAVERLLLEGPDLVHQLRPRELFLAFDERKIGGRGFKQVGQGLCALFLCKNGKASLFFRGAVVLRRGDTAPA